MQHRITYAGEFDASHQVGSEWPYCTDHLHGHKWQVFIDFHFDPMNPVYPSKDLDGLLGELVERNLNDMIRPASPTPLGLAGWLMERLLPRYKVDYVEVTYNGWGATVKSDDVRRK